MITVDPGTVVPRYVVHTSPEQIVDGGTKAASEEPSFVISEATALEARG
jgi:hypothetical protein